MPKQIKFLIFVILAVLVSVSLATTPPGRTLFKATISLFEILLNLLLCIAMALVTFAGPIGVGILAKIGISYADERINPNEQIGSKWHLLYGILIAIGIAILWMTLYPLIIEIPSWFKTMIHDIRLGGPFETPPVGIAILAFGETILAYLITSVSFNKMGNYTV